MTAYDKHREDVALFAEALRQMIEASPSVIGAFVVLVHNNGRSSAVRSPALDRDPLTVLAEIGRWRESYRNTAGLLEREIRQRADEIARLEDGKFEGRA